jgi:hypothetical protein
MSSIPNCPRADGNSWRRIHHAFSLSSRYCRDNYVACLLCWQLAPSVSQRTRGLLLTPLCDPPTSFFGAELEPRANPRMGAMEHDIQTSNRLQDSAWLVIARPAQFQGAFGVEPLVFNVLVTPVVLVLFVVSSGNTIAGSPVFHSGQLSTRRAVVATNFQYSAPVLTRSSLDCAIVVHFLVRRED